MPYHPTTADLHKISDVHLAFGTTCLLPPLEDIPEDFNDRLGNPYTKLASDLFFGNALENLEMTLHDGVTPALLQRAVQAHLTSREPRHEHKIRGVGFLISKFATIHGAK